MIILVATVLSFFQTNVTIKDLDLSGNDLSNKGARYLAEALRENTTINDLVSIFSDWCEVLSLHRSFIFYDYKSPEGSTCCKERHTL